MVNEMGDKVLVKMMFYLVAFVAAWTGLILAFRGYVVPGVMVLGFGYVMFSVVHSGEGGEING